MSPFRTLMRFSAWWVLKVDGFQVFNRIFRGTKDAFTVISSGDLDSITNYKLRFELLGLIDVRFLDDFTDFARDWSFRRG